MCSSTVIISKSSSWSCRHLYKTFARIRSRIKFPKFKIILNRDYGCGSIELLTLLSKYKRTWPTWNRTFNIWLTRVYVFSKSTIVSTWLIHRFYITPSIILKWATLFISTFFGFSRKSTHHHRFLPIFSISEKTNYMCSLYRTRR